MEWKRILAPLTGGEADAEVLAASAAIAAPFEAELAAVHVPADLAELMPWLGDSLMGGVQSAAIEGIRDAAVQGAAAARRRCEACGYHQARFTALSSPIGEALATESRLSDLVVFDEAASRGRGPLAEAFRHILLGEQRPVIVAKRPGPGARLVGGIAALAWDGGKEASRAMRTALPLLARAAKVVAIGAANASDRRFDLEALARFLGLRGIACEIERIAATGDAGPALLAATKAAGADVLVAGAFGHARLREYILGGTTRTFLSHEGPSLFLSH